MLKKLLPSLAFVICPLALATVPTVVVEAQTINVIPRPRSVDAGQGFFTLAADARVTVSGREAHRAADFFIERVNRATGFNLRRGKGKGARINFVIDKAVKGSEAYRLDVTTEGVTARASTDAGLYYAAQTMIQLLPPAIEEPWGSSRGMAWTMPAVSISDEPAFGYRGIMIDPCRHFWPVSVVKKQIERLAAYKFNRIHWHLTDDQGWRIEIKKYPELTRKGAVRTEGDGSQYGGYYTQEEVREVVAFAARHNIEIVPELEMPGHGLAAIAAYTWLSCRNVKTTPRIIWGVEDIVMCAGRETTMRFLEDVIDEMLPLFPSRLFHIGGDESPRQEWKTCDSCQHKMKELGLKKEAQLQSYVVGRIGKYLAAHGRRLVGWDEILEGGGLDTTAVVMSWRGEDGGIAAARAGHSALMTANSYGYYFDQFQSDPATEPTAIGGYSDLKKVYSVDPIPATLRKEGKERYIMGIQANCWSEYMYTPEIFEYRLYPRALALAETAWSGEERKDYEDFVRRLDHDAALRLRAHGINFHIPAPEQPGGSLDRMAFTDTMQLSLKTVRPLDIVYTTDGTLPTTASTRYTGPIRLARTTTVRTATVLPCGLMGGVRTITAEKQSPLRAAETPEQVKAGVTISVYRGTYLKPTGITGEPEKRFEAADLSPLRRQATVPASVRDVDNYAAVAEGYVTIPETGVYEFSSNNNEVWIDGRLLIDNTPMTCQRFSPNNAQIALAKGRHRIKVVFLGGIFGGWPTYWDDAMVRIRLAGGKWKNIGADMLTQ